MLRFDSIKGVGLMFFSLPFAGAGLFVLYLSFASVREGRENQHWTPTPARLLETKLESRRSNKSVTHIVTARYTYEVDGRAYESDRVSLHTGADNIGNWHRGRAAELKKVERAGGSLTAYVNPADPGKAVLYRGARSELVLFYSGFGGLFTLVGLGFFFGGIASLRSGRRRARLEAEFPGEPWRWRPGWSDGVIPAANRTTVITLGVAAAMWNGMIGFILTLTLTSSGRVPWAAVAIYGVFGLIGLGLFAWAIREWRVYRRYGAASLHLASVPGVLGGKLAGVVALPGYAEPDVYVTELRCERTVRRGKHSSTETLWKTERVLDAKKLPARVDGVQIPILFGIPIVLPASEYGVTWKLSVKGEQPGIDVALHFSVPVFRTAESHPDFQLDESSIARYAP
ncbi:MAG TPA: DUF3592 domain-containing protein [Kiritimatiellia bacterium]|nr:DUF3592 domain-containing protein [Kiritimatiellia bacterium]